MRKLALLAATALGTLGLSSAASAAECSVSGGIQYCFFVAGVSNEFTVKQNPNGTISGTIGREGIGAELGASLEGTEGITNFIDTYYFFTDTNGLGSGSVVTSNSGSGTDTDFSDVDVYTNGIFSGGPVPGVPTIFDPSLIAFDPVGNVTGGTNFDLVIAGQGSDIEVAPPPGPNTKIPITKLQPNYIVIKGLSRGNGSYGGNLTFTPTAAVPEPSTWAMMLFGFGAIGFGMRRRRKETTRVRFAF